MATRSSTPSSTRVSSGPGGNTPPASVPREEYLRYESFNYTHTYSIAGLPAAAIPVAIDAGLPVGVQVIGPAWREDLVLTASAALERAFGGYRLTEPFRERLTAPWGGRHPAVFG